MTTLKDFKERRAREFEEKYTAFDFSPTTTISKEELSRLKSFMLSHDAELIEIVRFQYSQELLEILKELRTREPYEIVGQTTREAIQLNEKIVGRKGWNNCLDAVLQALKNNKE